MTDKVDIFDFLKKVDDFDLNYIDSLSPEQKKSLSPYLIMMWMSGCKSPLQIRQLNVFLNSMVFNIPSTHNDLLFKLALIASDGKSKKYKWIKKRGKSKQYATTVDILKRHYMCSTEIALGYVPLLEYEDVAEIAYSMGEQEDTLKKIKKEMS